MPEDMKATDRTPARIRDMPEELEEEHLRNAISTPYSSSHTQKDDEDINVYGPEHEVQGRYMSQKLRWRRSHLYTYLSQWRQ